MLFTATRYPADYGFFPNTLSEDGDPLDVLVLTEEATFPGCHMMVRPLAIFWMTDENGPDAKIIAVPSRDPRVTDVQDLGDIDKFLVQEIEHFFKIYKDLEPDKTVNTRGWEGREAAVAEIEKSIIAAQIHD